MGTTAPLPNPDALIFDLDGVLWDTCGPCAVAWNRVLARLGIAYRTITAGDVGAVAGRSHLDAIRTSFPDLTEEQVARLADETAREDNLAIAEQGGRLYPGVREHVPDLASRMPLFIVSNCQQGYIEIFLESSGLAEHFADIECWGNTGRAKVENLASVIARNQLRRPVFVGDTDGDRAAADGNGVPFVWAAYGFGQASRYDHRIDHFGELRGLFA